MKVIARKLKVSPGSVHRWCRDITLTSEQEEQINARASVPQMRALRKANKRKQRDRKEHHRVQKLAGAKQLGKLTKRDLLVLGLGLYWGEGSKRSPGDVSLANTDPNLHEVFLRWLRLLGVRDDELIVALYIAPGYDPEKHLRWWKKRLGLKSLKAEHSYEVITKSSKRHIQRKGYHGTLTIRHGNIDLWCQIKGMLDVVPCGGFEPPLHG